MPTVLLLNDTRDQSNWGSQALTTALEQIISASVPYVRFKTLTSRWMNKDRFSDTVPSAPLVVDEYEFVADEWLQGRGGAKANEYMRLLDEVDAVVFNAEGSTYRINYCAILGLFMLWFAKQKFNKPALFLNGTVALTEVDRILPAMVRKTFAVLDAVAVREAYSLRNANQYVPGVNVKLVPDSVFALASNVTDCVTDVCRTTDEEFRRQPYFCLSSSMLPLAYRRPRKDSAIVSVLSQLKKLVPELVVMAKDPSDQWLKELAEEMGCRFFGPENSHYDLISILNHASFLISGRYHTIVMATIVGCPSVPLMTTSPKIDGLCELLGNEIGRPFDPTDLWSHIDSIVETAQRYLNEGERKRQKLREIATVQRHAAYEMGAMVRLALDKQGKTKSGALSLNPNR